ncbi:MAG: thiaminase II [Romboutsia sp.]|uniref:thiaminase II n=1 Tax=Romboutsia sp. TaxID=1965302 RepID=UPI003F2D5725
MLFTDHLFEGSKDIWGNYLNHPFIKEIGNGSLDKEKFKKYLIQDYLYLKEYTKVYCMGVIKSDTIKNINMFYEGANGILNDETANHISYLKGFKENILEVENYQYHKTNESYTSYMKSISMTGDFKEIIAVILPCTWSYSYIGRYLKENYSEFENNNFYKSWIDTYSSEEYTKFINEWIDFTNEVCKDLSEKEKQKLISIFRKASIYELDFWDMAYDGSELSYV